MNLLTDSPFLFSIILTESINRIRLIFFLPIDKIAIFYDLDDRFARQNKSYPFLKNLRKACETGDKGRCL
jgi:hypothetical protein